MHVTGNDCRGKTEREAEGRGGITEPFRAQRAKDACGVFALAQATYFSKELYFPTFWGRGVKVLRGRSVFWPEKVLNGRRPCTGSMYVFAAQIRRRGSTEGAAAVDRIYKTEGDGAQDGAAAECRAGGRPEAESEVGRAE